MDVRIGFAEFDATGGQIDVCIGWAEFDCRGTVATPAVRTSYSTTQAKKKKRPYFDEAADAYIIPVDMTDEDDEEAVVLAILLEVARYEFF